MSYIKFVTCEQVWQSREVIWKEDDWRIFKAKLAKRAQQVAEHLGDEYYLKFYEAIKDMSFDAAMEEYSKWCDGVQGCATFDVDSCSCLVGEAIHEALADAAGDVAPVIDSICDCYDDSGVYTD